MAMSEEHVATRKHQCAVFGGSKIDVAARAFELFPVRHDFAVNTQSCDAAVGIDLEAKMCDSFFVIDWKRILAVAAERQLWEEWHPLHRIARQFLFGGQLWEGCAFE